MKTVHKSVLLWFSAHEMFDLVTDVGRYPEFLPWCEQAKLVQTHPDGVTALIGMSIGGLRKSFTTRNLHVTDKQVKVQLVDGPFKHLDGQWDFQSMGEERACKVTLELNYSFDSVFGVLIGPLFDRIAATLMDAFVKRAEHVYAAD